MRSSMEEVSEMTFREYVPGKSTTSTVVSCHLKKPLLRSTVTPGQLPTRWRAPVKALKTVVLPQLGFPTRPMVKLTHPLLQFVICPPHPYVNSRQSHGQ